MPGTFKITIASGTVSSDLTNYPVCLLINASSGLSNKDLTAIFDELGNNSLKIQVFKEDKLTECYVEVATWDLVNEVAELHFLAPTILAASENIFYLHYNKDMADNSSYVGVTGSVVAQNVWASYTAVYHMNDNPASNVQVLDSAGGANTGTKIGEGEPIEVAGAVGKAQQGDGSNDYVNVPHVGMLAGIRFFEALVNFTAEVISGTTYHIVLHKYSTYRLGIYTVYNVSPNKVIGYFVDSLGAVSWFNFEIPSYGVPYHIVCLLNNSLQTELYFAGALVGTGNAIADNDNAAQTTQPIRMIGGATNRQSNIILDEARVSVNLLPTGWIAANNLSLNDQLVTYSNIERTRLRITLRK